MLRIDDIHASRRDVAHEFKSIPNQRKKSFLSPIHKETGKIPFYNISETNRKQNGKYLGVK